MLGRRLCEAEFARAVTRGFDMAEPPHHGDGSMQPRPVGADSFLGCDCGNPAMSGGTAEESVTTLPVASSCGARGPDIALQKVGVVLSHTLRPKPEERLLQHTIP